MNFKFLPKILIALFIQQTFNLHAIEQIQNSSQETINQELAAVRFTLNNYIEGTSYSRAAQINQAFYDQSELFLSAKKTDKSKKENEGVWIVPIAEYTTWFDNRKSNSFNGRVGRISNIQLEQDIATAKVNISIPKANMNFVDLFLLRKISGQWKIISKTAVSEKSNISGKRILFVVSNAETHGKLKKAAGSSFSEIVNAYHTFTEAGYQVDFISPKGGAISLAYINTSIPRHKKYLYNNDLMYSLAHSFTPQQVSAENYQAVHYIGGSSAIYGVPENKAIQALTMAIYEEHNGIVSSVCHGTAGIVNLKTKDGTYLVAGKRISGYPEAYENQNAAYFKEFPFLIQKTIEQGKGIFKVAKKGAVNVWR